MTDSLTHTRTQLFIVKDYSVVLGLVRHILTIGKLELLLLHKPEQCSPLEGHGLLRDVLQKDEAILDLTNSRSEPDFVLSPRLKENMF